MKGHFKLFVAVLAVMLLISSIPVFAAGTPDIKAIIADSANWKSYPDAKLTVKDGKLTGEIMGPSGYYGKKFTNETFKMNVFIPTEDFDKDSSWPGFYLRASDPQWLMWPNDDGKYSDAYLFVIAYNRLELQKWMDGEQSWIKTYPSKEFKAGKDNLVEIGAVDTDKGVDTFIKINGKKIAEFVDPVSDSNPALKEGYFGVVAVGVPVTISPVVEEAVSPQETKAADTVNSDSASNPKTGDSSMTFYIVLACGALFIMLVLGKKLRLS